MAGVRAGNPICGSRTSVRLVHPQHTWGNLLAFLSGCFEHLNGIGIDQFEVIQTTGPNEGPRGH